MSLGPNSEDASEPLPPSLFPEARLVCTAVLHLHKLRGVRDGKRINRRLDLGEVSVVVEDEDAADVQEAHREARVQQHVFALVRPVHV
eukprot:CAMPEP_0196755222 /NCGR_PEP_ID=MMETSP1091-20130531/96649_1 /TAXON_ID=302021 /ORGANISM="Rhodomonas sp., Strain CCMP768" /LENGTH=87 /DNA_ID=CAMNT_0042103607 /DNA_START=150 /DNA_END=410 /DNA_ORIENTATION=-